MHINQRILILPISGRNGASSRQRVYEYLPHLERAGFETIVMPPAEKKGRGLARLVGNLVEERSIIKAAAKADIVFIQKRLFPDAFIYKIKKLKKKLVFDYDDSIFTSPKGDWSAGTRRRVEGRLRAVLTSADLVVAGNSFLAEYARAAGAKLVEVVPTGLHAERHRVRVHREGGAVIGWIGSSVNHRYLDMLAGVLPGLAAEFPGLKLLVVSDKDYAMPGVEVENRRWSESREADDLACMDIGVMPLMDDDWTRGKCAFKALQYMASGVPAVCSAVGANNEVIEDGADGFLVTDEAGWEAALRRLLLDRGLREKMGMAGAEKVRERYDISPLAEKLVSAINTLAGARG